ncbi:MAG TPA: hypothetical protein VLV83_25120 [Acidobacteriota bacterium]|nr:hypothetical protein [Acidobacteriota bacterium]
MTKKGPLGETIPVQIPLPPDLVDQVDMAALKMRREIPECRGGLHRNVLVAAALEMALADPGAWLKKTQALIKG